MGYIYAFIRYAKFLKLMEERYTNLDTFNEVYKAHRDAKSSLYTDHETCYPDVSWYHYYTRILLAIVFLSLNLFNNYVLGRYYLYLRYKKRIIKSHMHLDQSLKEDALVKCSKIC